MKLPNAKDVWPISTTFVTSHCKIKSKVHNSSEFAAQAWNTGGKETHLNIYLTRTYCIIHSSIVFVSFRFYGNSFSVVFFLSCALRRFRSRLFDRWFFSLSFQHRWIRVYKINKFHTSFSASGLRTSMACGNYLRNRAIRSSCRSKRQWLFCLYTKLCGKQCNERIMNWVAYFFSWDGSM